MAGFAGWRLPPPQINIALWRRARQADPDVSTPTTSWSSRRRSKNSAPFLSPLKLPTDLNIRSDACGGAFRRPYDLTTKTVTICYEMVARILDVAKAQTSASDQDRNQATVGTIVEALFHETAYALFDLFDVPIWGRIDDAADRLTAFVMMSVRRGQRPHDHPRLGAVLQLVGAHLTGRGLRLDRGRRNAAFLISSASPRRRPDRLRQPEDQRRAARIPLGAMREGIPAGAQGVRPPADAVHRPRSAGQGEGANMVRSTLRLFALLAFTLSLTAAEAGKRLGRQQCEPQPRRRL